MGPGPMAESADPGMADTTQTRDTPPAPGGQQNLHERCAHLLKEWRNSDSLDERTPTDIGAIFFEA